MGARASGGVAQRTAEAARGLGTASHLAHGVRPVARRDVAIQLGELERRIADFVGKEDAILYISCWDANGGLFETLFGKEDAIISDELNHASIIDGIRLCKAARFRYKNCDMADLERCLQEAQGARSRVIATDGVFSMDGSIAPLQEICALAEKYASPPGL